MSDARDRVLLTLKDGPAYPADIAETCGMPLGTVKNEINRLRKHGLVEYTGETDPRTRARQVRLTDKRCGVTGVTDSIGVGDAVTPSGGSPLTSVYVNERREAEF